MAKWFVDLGAKIVAQPLEFLKLLGIGLACVFALSVVIKLIVWCCKR